MLSVVLFGKLPPMSVLRGFVEVSQSLWTVVLIDRYQEQADSFGVEEISKILLK